MNKTNEQQIKSTRQIIRIDGRNVFVEVMNSAFEISKLQINFIEYNKELERKSRQIKNIAIYLDLDEALLLSHDILNGKMCVLAKKAKEVKDKGGYKYCKEIYSNLGGVSATNLKKRGKERPDGKAISRQFKITPGDKVPWILSAECGAGEENETGLIVPKDKPEEIVRVPVSDNDLKKMALVIKAHIEAYWSAIYAKNIQFKDVV